jgi:hypothetical protein
MLATRMAQTSSYLLQHAAATTWAGSSPMPPSRADEVLLEEPPSPVDPSTGPGEKGVETPGCACVPPPPSLLLSSPTEVVLLWPVTPSGVL